jgi:hypothetical protein
MVDEVLLVEHPAEVGADESGTAGHDHLQGR